MKVIQDVLGHSDISTTMNIYADVTKELKQKEFGEFEKFISKQFEDTLQGDTRVKRNKYNLENLIVL